MKRLRFIPILILALVLGACGAMSPTSSESFAPGDAGLAPGAPMTGGGAAPALEPRQQEADQSAGGEGQTGQPGVERLVIKTADVSLQVEAVRDSESAVRAKVNELGGYIVKVETNGDDDNLTARITFRVPAERFDDALSGVQGLAKKLLSRTVTGDDVTEEFVDLDARLRNLEATRDRLQTFLDRAETVEDALKVNDSLSTIQGEIEQIKGRIQFLKQSAALSTISVYLTQVPVAPLIAEDSWQPLVVARDALRELLGFGQGVVNLVIVLLVWAPLWLPLLLFVRWAWRRLRSAGKKPQGPAPSEAA